MDLLTISLVQADLAWENKTANFSKLEDLLASIERTDLIILPEMFSTGFSMSPENLWDAPDGLSLQWMRKIAKAKNAAISGSAIVKEHQSYYNRLYFVFPSGEYRFYNKKHLFTLAGEEKVYTAGDRHLWVEYRGWKIMPLVCYDLRFPVWCRNTEEADLQLYVANWPERRSRAWKALLQARAIENMCFVAGVNRVGTDGNNVHHSGDSAVYNELGEPLLEFPPSGEAAQTIILSKERMLESRRRFQFLSDRDPFEIKG